ncbi:MAG: hypothetical protein M3Z25_09960 [Actinomycetota bacterium]|nr:hypothetical protein [Actinomycetota bacterium]
MSSVEDTTYRADHDSATDHGSAAGHDSVDGQGSAAERLGGPTGSSESAERARSEPAGALASRSTETNATLIPADRAGNYQTRWTELKGEFVDEPRRAVRGANELVGEVLDELEGLFKRQREDIERDLDNDQASTEDLRLAMGRYRSFFDRLLTI